MAVSPKTDLSCAFAKLTSFLKLFFMGETSLSEADLIEIALGNFQPLASEAPLPAVGGNALD